MSEMSSEAKVTLPPITPGSWRWVADDQGVADEWGWCDRGEVDPGFTTRDYGGNKMLYADGGPGLGQQSVVSAGSGEYDPVCGGTAEECTANARALAAVPLMLEALKAVWETADDYEGPTWDKVRAALEAAGAAVTP